MVQTTHAAIFIGVFAEPCPKHIIPYTHIMINRRCLLTLKTWSPLNSLKFTRNYGTTQLTSFDERWKKLTQAEKDLVAKEYEHLQKGDWRSLTIDQKRIRIILKIKDYVYFHIFILVYTIAYGVPEIKDSKEGLKIAFTTLGLIGVAVGLFAFLRSFGTIINLFSI